MLWISLRRQGVYMYVLLSRNMGYGYEMFWGEKQQLR